MNVLRKACCLIISTLSLALIGWAFWYQDWQYSLPTPRPPHLTQTAFGTALPLPKFLKGIQKTDHRLILLNFFNPDCPCSRFNAAHLQRLFDLYNTSIDFYVVLEGSGSEVQQKFADCHLPLTAISDADGRIARVCGVYATPQAVLLDGQSRLVYRGNYNVSRYCTDPSREFVRLAIEALLRGRKQPVFADDALRAYGCALPVSNSAEIF